MCYRTMPERFQAPAAIVLTPESSRAVMDALSAPPAPTPALIKLMRRHRTFTFPAKWLTVGEPKREIVARLVRKYGEVTFRREGERVRVDRGHS